MANKEMKTEGQSTSAEESNFYDAFELSVWVESSQRIFTAGIGSVPSSPTANLLENRLSTQCR
jgi:hypothetical protein